MAGQSVGELASQGIPLWLVVLGALVTVVLVPLFNLMKPYILTAEQRENRAARLREKADAAETEAMALLRRERDEAVSRYENEFRQRMELVGEHKFVSQMFAEMTVRHQECEESNRALAERMARLEALVPHGAASYVEPNTKG